MLFKWWLICGKGGFDFSSSWTSPSTIRQLLIMYFETLRADITNGGKTQLPCLPYYPFSNRKMTLEENTMNYSRVAWPQKKSQERHKAWSLGCHLCHGWKLTWKTHFGKYLELWQNMFGVALLVGVMRVCLISSTATKKISLLRDANGWLFFCMAKSSRGGLVLSESLFYALLDSRGRWRSSYSVEMAPAPIYPPPQKKN